MAIDFDATDGSLFPRLGRVGAMLLSVNETQAGVESTVADLLGRYPPVDQDITGQLATARATTISALKSLMTTPQIVARDTLLRMVKADQPTRAGSVLDAVKELIRQMIAEGKSVPRCVVGSTATAFPSNIGDGSLVVGLIRGDGFTQENLTAEAARVECTADLRGGTTTGGLAETFKFFGVPGPGDVFDWTWPTGSGASATLQAASALVSYPTGQNRLVNGGFDSWNGTTNPLKWVKSGTLSKENSLVYGSGSAARVAAGDTATLTQPFIDSANGTGFRPSPLTALSFGLWVRASATLSGGTLSIGWWDGSDWLDDGTGSPAKVDIALSGTGTTYTAKGGTIGLPAVLPASLSLRVAVTVGPVGGDVILDHLAAVVPTAAYSGGPTLAVFAGATQFAAGDGWDVDMTNDRAGADFGATWQALFDRTFGMKALAVGGLLLPSSDSPTILDSLIG
jgi:hypothetical protein